jgi:hypothetical protein
MSQWLGLPLGLAQEGGPAPLSHGLVLGGLLITVIFACPGGIAEAAARVLGWAARPERPWPRPGTP